MQTIEQLRKSIPNSWIYTDDDLKPLLDSAGNPVCCATCKAQFYTAQAFYRFHDGENASRYCVACHKRKSKKRKK